MRHTVIGPIVVLVFVLPTCFAQTRPQSIDDRKLLVESFVISGTEAIDSAELADITNSMTGSSFNNDEEELQERVKAQFQDHGYFKVDIERFDIKVIDPLASPMPVRLEALVREGPLCRFSEVAFTGNHAFDAETLRSKLPIYIGQEFKRGKVAAGLEKIMSLYSSAGFLDITLIPDTSFNAGDAVKLGITIEEGPQYRMNRLEIVGPAEIAEKLRVRWQIAPGTILDAHYVAQFLNLNHSLLPGDFTAANGVDLITNCPDGTVDVHLHLVENVQHTASDRATHVNCPSPSASKVHSN